MNCSICSHPGQIEILRYYIYGGSFRETADIFGVGYRSLQRHIDLCIASICSEREEREYQQELEKWDELLRIHYGFKERKMRPKSIVKKPVDFSWSRRAWNRKKGEKEEKQPSRSDEVSHSEKEENL